VNFKLGPKTFSIPSARLPQIGLPYLKLLTAIRIPLPKAFKVGGGRAALMSVLVVAGGFGASFALVINGTNDVPTWPEAGAVYALPNTNGERLAPDESDPATRSQTLQINLANGVRLDKLHLKNLDLGKAGLDKSLYVTGVTGAQVDVGLITVRNSSAPTMDWSRINAGCIQIAGEMDGHTNAMTIDATVPNLVIDSDRGAGTYVAENSQVDRIIVQTTGGTATIGEILIDDVDASVGAWTWEGINAGCIVVENNNKFGNGTGINVASVVMNNTVKSRSITDNVLETPISVK
jgi:hypothetical protein